MTTSPTQIESSALGVLAELGKLPATSYWEDGPARYLAVRARDAGLDVSLDEWGNVLATKAGTDPNAPGIAFVAHTDHPGYEVIEQDGAKLTLKTMGGVGIAAGRAGTPVLVMGRHGVRIKATITGADDPDGDFAKSREAAGWLGTDTVYAELEDDADLGDLPKAVVPDLLDFELGDDDLIRMRAADDLAGCAAILAALESIVEQPTKGSVYGLFTRAEEVGLVGARIAAEQELLPKNTIIVSVETSSVLPGAEIGDGVVIRTGDRAATFDYEAEAYLGEAVQRIKSADPSFIIQRQLMSAGGCEASAFKAFGYKVTGTAFPLGAWHNRGETGVEPEFISKDDFVGGAILLAEAGKLAGMSPAGVLGRLSDTPSEEADRLKSDRLRPEYVKRWAYSGFE
ncbi:M20/M25/M40 family metallo-hydrolase [Candidatus Lucifugimonas marina]|uniref:M28 family peptidase n=1 Tax=Candidatus Lucifugimonas marina TaxID=3038979 RepID=A0AAJ5ZEF7_9CHLR|nr:M28 family peptidase [SAR202 cluster bacterium JH702]MDG0869134.1 M28 family peptidase [SAR202 cluster bacterium JH639]WFG35754.1 M28 family peptidase [SAR202 cluster bacterium JH545]WFG39699.1 M28 family peptidase [SAR202 cluster bacterium JH1073]